MLGMHPEAQLPGLGNALLSVRDEHEALLSHIFESAVQELKVSSPPLSSLNWDKRPTQKG